jgi:hypothetical protein
MTTATTILLVLVVVQLERLIRNAARTERRLKRRP